MPVFVQLLSSYVSKHPLKKIQITKVDQAGFEQADALLQAVRDEDEKGMKLLIEDGHNPDCQNENKETPLLVAISKGNLQICRLLIESRVDVNMGGAIPPFFLMVRPLCQAVKLGRKDIVKLLMESGCEKNLRDEYGKSAFCYAVSGGDEEMVLMFIDAGYDINTGSKDCNYTPLHEACSKGKLAIVKMLLEAGADPNCYEVTHRLAPAFFTMLIPVHRELLEHGYDINTSSLAGDTVLHYAILHGNIPLVRFLLERGADLDKKCNRYNFAPNNMLNKLSQQDSLRLAAEERYFDICKVLIQHGYDLEAMLCPDSPERDLLRRLTKSRDVILIQTVAYAVGHLKWLKPGFVAKCGKSEFGWQGKSWFASHSSSPFSLKNLCRVRVRKQLQSVSQHRSILPLVAKLEIPKSLIQYILLEIL